jgi:hypothetical protein
VFFYGVLHYWGVGLSGEFLDRFAFFSRWKCMQADLVYARRGRFGIDDVCVDFAGEHRELNRDRG